MEQNTNIGSRLPMEVSLKNEQDLIDPTISSAQKINNTIDTTGHTAI